MSEGDGWRVIGKRARREVRGRRVERGRASSLHVLSSVQPQSSLALSRSARWPLGVEYSSVLAVCTEQ